MDSALRPARWLELSASKARTSSIQARQGLANIVALVQEAGGGTEHITRLTWFVLDKKEYLLRLTDLGAAYRSVMGMHFPTMSLVQVVALVEDEVRVEIEATAIVRK
jgi:enamine deaminase RidA (YjgF/YER057c/UK114 family)